MFPIINIGPLAIQAGGFIFLLSFLIGSWLSARFSIKLGTHTDAIENIALYGLLAGLLGARVGFLLKNFSVFQNNPLSVFSLTPSMLDASFGILVGGLTAFILAQKINLPLWPTLDTISPFFLAFFIAFQLTNLANGNAYGLPTDLPWGIMLWNTTRHPVQVYALFLCAGLLIYFFYQTQFLKRTGFSRSGILFFTISAGLAGIILFTQAFVADKILLGPIDFLQVVSFIVLLICLAMIHARLFPKYNKTEVFISMGSNEQATRKLDQAIQLIGDIFRIRNASSRYETQDVTKDPKTANFTNQVIQIETDLPAKEIIKILKSIEKQAGRQHDDKHTIALDLDLLIYGNEVFQIEKKLIPSPDMLKYRYIVQPMAEMVPAFRHPANGLSINQILEAINDETPVVKLDKT